jgi:hypothetical protein
VWQAGLNHIENPNQIGVDRVGPRLDRLSLSQRADPGVGHHDVEASEFGDTVGDRLPHRGAVAHVDDDRVDADPFLLDQSRRLIEILAAREWISVALDVRADVQGDDAGALRGQCHRMRSTLAPRGADTTATLLSNLSTC